MTIYQFLNVKMPSLDYQLAQITNNQAIEVLDRKRRQNLHSASLIYNSKTAVTQNLEFIFDNALNPLNELTDVELNFKA